MYLDSVNCVKQELREDYLYLTLTLLKKTIPHVNKQLQDTLTKCFLENQVSDLLREKMKKLNNKSVFQEIQSTITSGRPKFLKLLNAYEDKVTALQLEVEYNSLLQNLVLDVRTYSKDSEEWRTHIRKRMLSLLLYVHWNEQKKREEFLSFFDMWKVAYPENPLQQRIFRNSKIHSLEKKEKQHSSSSLEEEEEEESLQNQVKKIKLDQASNSSLKSNDELLFKTQCKQLLIHENQQDNSAQNPSQIPSSYQYQQNIKGKEIQRDQFMEPNNLKPYLIHLIPPFPLIHCQQETNERTEITKSSNNITKNNKQNQPQSTIINSKHTTNQDNNKFNDLGKEQQNISKSPKQQPKNDNHKPKSNLHLLQIQSNLNPLYQQENPLEYLNINNSLNSIKQESVEDISNYTNKSISSIQDEKSLINSQSDHTSNGISLLNSKYFPICQQQSSIHSFNKGNSQIFPENSALQSSQTYYQPNFMDNFYFRSQIQNGSMNKSECNQLSQQMQYHHEGCIPMKQIDFRKQQNIHLFDLSNEKQAVTDKQFLIERSFNIGENIIYSYQNSAKINQIAGVKAGAQISHFPLSKNQNNYILNSYCGNNDSITLNNYNNTTVQQKQISQSQPFDQQYIKEHSSASNIANSSSKSLSSGGNTSLLLSNEQSAFGQAKMYDPQFLSLQSSKDNNSSSYQQSSHFENKRSDSKQIYEFFLEYYSKSKDDFVWEDTQPIAILAGQPLKDNILSNNCSKPSSNERKKRKEQQSNRMYESSNDNIDQSYEMEENPILQ